MNGEPVVSAVCDEGGQKIVRNVYFMPLSIENLKLLWEKSQHYHNIFGIEVEGNFQRFASLLLNGDDNGISPTGLFWVVDDFVGVFYITRIIPNVDALVHYIFFDRKHIGREDLILKMLRWGFDTFGLNRMSAELPVYASNYAKILLTKRLGFKQEGIKRQASQNKHGWHDVILYGKLKSELSELHKEESNGSTLS